MNVSGLKLINKRFNNKKKDLSETSYIRSIILSNN